MGTEAYPGSAGDRSRLYRELWPPAILGLLALALRMVHLEQTPNLDELLHILAARQYLVDGTLEVLGEPYVRARLFTFWVIGMMSLFGETLTVSRIPSVISGTALVVALYLFVRWQAGRVAGAVAALLLATWPTALYFSQTSRFYTLHSLAFFLGAVALFAFTLPDRTIRFRLVALLLSIPCLVLAWHLQPVTLLGLVPLGVWVTLSLGHELSTRDHAGDRRILLVGGSLLVVGGVILLPLILTSDWFAGMWSLFRFAPEWAEANRNELGFYHRRIFRDYPAFWSLFPVFLLVAAVARPRLSLFAAVVFFLALILHSLAAWKQERYFFYALPFFFLIIGVAAAEGIARFPGAVERLVHQLGFRSLSAPLVRTLQWGVALTILAFFVLVMPTPRTILSVLLDRGSDTPSEIRSYYQYGLPAFSRAAGEMEQLLRTPGTVVLGVPATSTLFHLGRIDFTSEELEFDGLTFEVSPSYHPGQSPPGLGVIRSPESMERMLACHPAGVALIERSRWRRSWGVPDSVADVLEARTESIPFPQSWRMVGFRWTDGVDPNACQP